MLEWTKTTCGCEGRVPGFSSDVIEISHQTNYDNRDEYGYVVKARSLPFEIKKQYFRNIKDAQYYADKIIVNFIKKLNEIITSKEVADENHD